MKTIIVIPTYNEKDNIKELIRAIRTKASEPKIDILIVDSASPDGTATAILNMQKTDSALHLINQEAKLGLGKAYLEGMQWVLDHNYDYLITMDADFSHHPRYINYLLTEIENCDLVVGSRYTRFGELRNWPLVRRFLSRFANWYARIISGLPFCDLTSGFHCFRTALLKKILRRRISTEGYAFLIELKFLAVMEQARCKEIPIVFTNRTQGESKISKRVIFESMCFVLKLAFQRNHIHQITTASMQRQSVPSN